MHKTDWCERRSKWRKQPEDARSDFDIDYSRIVHSASFRRLQGKTQILNLGDGDFYRTRLTHSLEVAQIAGGIGLHLKANHGSHPGSRYVPESALIQAVGFAHDLGHAPFGHGGEEALNYCMRHDGGFEGNGQTLRVLATLEKFSCLNGIDLTRRALLGVLKYPVSYRVAKNKKRLPGLIKGKSTIGVIDRDKSKPPKCYMDSESEVVEWILKPLCESDRVEFIRCESDGIGYCKPLNKSFDCSIMDIADDIAYGVHDLEDAISVGLVSEKTFRKHVTAKRCRTFLDALKKKYPEEGESDFYDHFVEGLFADSRTRKRFISRLVHHFISNVKIKTLRKFEEPLLKFRAKMRCEHSDFLDGLKSLIFKEVIGSPGVRQLEFKGQQMVVAVFEALQSDPESLLPVDVLEGLGGRQPCNRDICDYVAGMTDGYLLKTYDRLFSPRMGSIFDKL
ncbi:MAG: anti-phage deoxyguanosine triphosphatase [Rhodospirillales bacterium]|nr:anti-phage deoxyguanosine triphosphatase [Rhodospirillales bacterium]